MVLFGQWSGFTGGRLWEFIDWPHFQFALCFAFAVEDVLSQIPVPAAMLLPAMIDSYPSGITGQSKPFIFHTLLW